jgi:hypothetical protein
MTTLQLVPDIKYQEQKVNCIKLYNLYYNQNAATTNEYKKKTEHDSNNIIAQRIKINCLHGDDGANL